MVDIGEKDLDLYHGSYVEFVIENVTGRKRYKTANAERVKDEPETGMPRYRCACPVNEIQIADMITRAFHYTVDGEKWNRTPCGRISTTI